MQRRGTGMARKCSIAQQTSGVFILFVIITCAEVISETKDQESRLVADLLDKKTCNGSVYNPLDRPIMDPSKPLEVAFDIKMQQLITVDEVKQVMKTNLWLSFTWVDPCLLWDPKKYGGVAAIRLNHKKVWTPDVVLFNNNDGHFEASYKSQVVLYHSYLLWVPPTIYTSTCSINVEFFPFDQQECELKFGSWTYNTNELTLNYAWVDSQRRRRPYADISEYKPSQVWDIIEGPAEIVTSNTDPPRQLMIYKFVLRRKSLFYTCNLILPCVFISILSIAGFFLPAHSGEKITLSISILFALVVFILLISKLLPADGNAIPLLVKYLLFTFICNTVSVVCSVVITNWNFRSPLTHRMPELIQTIFLKFLPNLFRMKRPDHMERYRKAKNKRSTNSDPETKGHRKAEPSDIHLWPPEIREVVKSIDAIAHHLKKEDEVQTVKEDWVYVASVVDRALLYIWLLLTISGTIGTILVAPHVFESIDQRQIIDAFRTEWDIEVPADG